MELMEAPLEPGDATAGKPVSTLVKPQRASVWSLAFASGCDRQQAERAASLLRGDALSERLFVLWWQETTLEPLPEDAVVAPAYTTIHHEIMDRVQEHLGAGCGSRTLPEAPLLPCRSCGRVFRSFPPRYARV